MKSPDEVSQMFLEYKHLRLYRYYFAVGFKIGVSNILGYLICCLFLFLLQILIYFIFFQRLLHSLNLLHNKPLDFRSLHVNFFLHTRFYTFQFWLYRHCKNGGK